MKKQGTADLPLHNGTVPGWLAARMAKLGKAVIETVVLEYGKSEVLRRISDPFWFQSLGCVMGMDWHSSGITTSVLGALKKGINPMSHEIGIYICGGRGKHSRKTPQELVEVADKTGLDGAKLVRASRLSARIDNNAVQDGYQIYLHGFIVTDQGDWTVIQQGMNGAAGMARRYHWLSAEIQSFVKNPHAFVYGKNLGPILNLVHTRAGAAQESMVELSKEKPATLLPEIRSLKMPRRHNLISRDVDLRRLGSILALANECQPPDFESLLLLEGLGPRTLQSLALVSEVIYGSPVRFTDPARFSFAHGGKDGHPFPVPLKVYDKTIGILEKAVDRAKIGQRDKQRAIRRLFQLTRRIESNFNPVDNFDQAITQERNDSWKYGGRAVAGFAQPPGPSQMTLF